MNITLLLADVIEGITGVIGTFLYGLFSIFFWVIDWLQDLFRALAGLAPIIINGETVNANDNEAKYDIIFYLIQSDVVIDVFISMLVFMVVMLVILTALALIRNLYQDKSKPPMEIINKAFKALWTVFIVPVTLILGLMFGNIILQAVDEGTRVGGSSKMSATLFISSAYDANRLRNGEDTEELAENLYKLVDNTNFEKCSGVNKILTAGQYSNQSAFYDLTESEFDELARLLDQAIVNGEVKSDRTGKAVDYAHAWRNDFTFCYKLLDINYLVMAFGGGIIVGIFIRICYGMVGRIFKCIFDVVLIPVVCAIMPLDDGKAVGSWKSDIVKNVTMAYSTVGIMNIYFAILPVINNIDFTGIVGAGILNTFTTLMLQIIGIATASSMIGTVNGWLSGLGMGNVLSEGDATKKALNDGWKQITDKVNAKKRIEGTAKFIGAYKGGSAQAKKEGKSGFWAGMTSAMGTTGAGKKFGEFAQTLPKAVGEGREAGKKSYQARQTYVPFDPGSDRAEEKKARYAMNKIAKDINDRIAEIDASSMTAKDKEKAKDSAYASSQAITNYESKGGKYMINGKEVTANWVKLEIEIREKANAKLKANNDIIEATTKAIGEATNAYDTAVAMKISKSDISNYLEGRTMTGSYNEDQIRQLAELKALKEGYEAKASESVRAATLQDKSGIGAKKYNIDGIDVALADMTGQQFAKMKKSDIEELFRDKIYGDFFAKLDKATEIVDNATAEITENRDAMDKLDKDLKHAQAEKGKALVEKTASGSDIVKGSGI